MSLRNDGSSRREAARSRRCRTGANWIDTIRDMDREAATNIVHRIFENGFARGDFEGLHRYVASDYAHHSPMPAPGPGPDGFEARIRGMRSAFGDFEVEIHDVTADGNRTWFRRPGNRTLEHVRSMGLVARLS